MDMSYSAFCTDFYINQKLSLRMDLPTSRESVLGLMDVIRKVRPSMNRLRRFEGELALETPAGHDPFTWLAMRRTSLRSGIVNPPSLEDGYRLHRSILETAPYYLSISPLEIDHLELVFGFDLEAETNRNDIVLDVLLADSPLAGLIDRDREPLLEVQPGIRFALDELGQVQASVEVKTRTRTPDIVNGRFEGEPISVYLTLRYGGIFSQIDELPVVFDQLTHQIREIADTRVLPNIVMPIREAIASRPG